MLAPRRGADRSLYDEERAWAQRCQRLRVHSHLVRILAATIKLIEHPTQISLCPTVRQPDVSPFLFDYDLPTARTQTG